MSVLVDSSIWIDSSRTKSPVGKKLKEMILKNEPIFILRIIQVEVCQGTRTEEEFQRLWEGFLGFDNLPVSDRLMGISAWNFFKCRKKGITISTIDSIIATASREHQILLWTIDKCFKKIQPIIGFELLE